MLLIYAHNNPARLQYICSFIFKELMGIDFKISIDSEVFKNYDGPKINYSDKKFTAEEFHIQNHQLLFEEDIKNQAIDCFTINNNKAFFKTATSDFPFDIFAASFYLISRYEEYLPHEKDSYGRYDCERSLAYREGFLNLPLINIWVKVLAESIQLKYQIFNIQYPIFRFEPTYDIDIAYSYKHKGLLRNIGGFFKSPSSERIQVLTGTTADPFDCYDWLKQLHQKYQLAPIYFFLVAAKNGRYDKNILPYTNAMRQLIKDHAKNYTVALHPSWQSGDDKALLKKEKLLLEETSEDSVSKSRQHYIRFNLPEGYQRLITAGLTDDYSMGYGSINGFRASVASPFYWFNLEKNEQTTLYIHPFCFMDANSLYEQRQNAEQTWQELLHYISICKTVGGTLISIWHNNFLGTSRDFSGWRTLYEKFIAQVQQ